MPVGGSNRSVGRPREFDEEQVLVAAMEEFWRKGYEATSVADLCRQTGLHKGSLYQAFGDKHELFRKALQYYEERQFRDVAAVAFQSDSPLESIKAAAHQLCQEASHGNGCMVINAMVELAPHDPEVGAMLQAAGAKRLRVVSDLIAKAQEAGEIRLKHEPERLARQLMVTLAGGAAMSKGLFGKDEMLDVIDILIDSWT